MKRFRFPMKGLETIRQMRVDEARLVLARSEAGRQAEEERVMSLEQKIDQTVSAAQREGVLDIHEVLEEQHYLEHLRLRRDEALDRLAHWIDTVEADRQRLLQARKEHKALERLRERRYLEFAQAVLREEGQISDELAGTAHWNERREA